MYTLLSTQTDCQAQQTENKMFTVLIKNKT